MDAVGSAYLEEFGRHSRRSSNISASLARPIKDQTAKAGSRTHTHKDTHTLVNILAAGMR
eukprot:2002957-Pleurochrysis_carterae.AAC.1